MGRRVLERVGSALTEERMRSIGERERGIYGTPPGPGEVAKRLYPGFLTKGVE